MFLSWSSTSSKDQPTKAPTNTYWGYNFLHSWQLGFADFAEVSWSAREVHKDRNLTHQIHKFGSTFLRLIIRCPAYIIVLFFVCKISMKSETGAFLTYSPALQDELSLTDVATKSSSTALTLKALGTAASTYLTLGWCRGKWRTARHQCAKSIKIQVELFSADMTNTLFGSTWGKKPFAQTSCPHMPSIQNQILSPYPRVRYWYGEWRGRPSRA